MTILPYDRYFGRWQRAKVRAQALVRDLKNWCADRNDTLPDWWNPDRAEKEYTEVLSEMERVMRDHRKGS